MARRRSRYGTVVGFDERAGLGVVVDTADGNEYPFHCTAIVDGSRRTDVGRDVIFSVVAGRGGRWEATLIDYPTGSPSPG